MDYIISLIDELSIDELLILKQKIKKRIKKLQYQNVDFSKENNENENIKHNNELFIENLSKNKMNIEDFQNINEEELILKLQNILIILEESNLFLI